MEFVHQPYLPGETISAIATPPGMGGIAIIRISGKEALDVGSRLFSGNVRTYQSHTAHYGRVVDLEGNRIDEAVLLVFLGKRSFTGEDTVEIQCHGGTIAAKKVLHESFRAGARPARPGEFTFKAFMNGKLDLAQAEAVSELISAKNEKAFTLASGLLEGRLSEKITSFQKEIVRIAAIFEAWVDFPEEGLEFATKEELLFQIAACVDQIGKLMATYDEGRKLTTGLHLSIVGTPNVGKSSLMNALLGHERAIVTPIAGTTRDVLAEDLVLGDLHCRLIDTAGIRQTEDVIEQMGIARARKAYQEADLILFVLDASRELSSEERELMEELPTHATIAIWNKIDLESAHLPALPFAHVVKLSARQQIGIECLRAKIDEVIWKRGKPGREELLISHLRHFEALRSAKEALTRVISSLKEEISPEFLVSDLRAALFQLGTIIGTDVSEEILDSIFSQFCIGK